MADLTIGEVGNVLQLNLVSIDQTQSPPARIPLDLTNATQVRLSWVIVDQTAQPQPPSNNVNMQITNAPVGVVQYTFLPGDLVKPPTMSKNGLFRFTVKVTFSTGVILIAAQDGLLTIKDDAVL